MLCSMSSDRVYSFCPVSVCVCIGTFCTIQEKNPFWHVNSAYKAFK